VKLTLFHDPGFAAPIGNHIMPMRKFALVADRLRDEAAFEIVAPEPVTRDDLLRVHTPEYITAIETGEPSTLAESQKFPWSPALYPSVLLTNGGVLAAARKALDTGVSGALASGFHHSCHDHGEGFCTFNGLVVALDKLKSEGRIESAAILDMDLHYGNGTATLAATRPWIFALSIYGNDYWQNETFRDVRKLHHKDGENHRSVPIVPTGGPDGAHLLDLMENNLEQLLSQGKPDLLLYQAGADPYREDPYSPLDLSHDDLKARDRRVFEFARSHGIPVAWVLAGGYTHDIDKVVQVHVNTAHACAEVFPWRD
jgi:acetoin utilization deacetylase AcuC-like enzyme